MQIITRAEAEAQGLKRYFTGKPCKHGHISELWIKGGCIECQLSKRRAANAKRLSAEWEQYKRENQHRFSIPIMSRQEAKDAGSNFYFTGHACANGHTTKRSTHTKQCYGCRDAKRDDYKKRGLAQMYDKRSREKHKEKIRAAMKIWRSHNTEHRRAYMKKWTQENREHRRLYKQANRARIAEQTVARQERTRQATPLWANRDSILLKNKERQRMTAITGVLHHVDHKIPLQGENVCGLHVAANLRVIPARDNLSKNNKWETA